MLRTRDFISARLRDAASLNLERFSSVSHGNLKQFWIHVFATPGIGKAMSRAPLEHIINMRYSELAAVNAHSVIVQPAFATVRANGRSQP